MKYEIIGKTVPVVEVTLDKNESVYTQTGAMAWQSEGINMKTNAHGGVMKSLGRMFTGESIFMNTFTSEVENGKVAFATTVPGDIKDIKIAFSKRLTAGLFGGEGFILQKAQGEGMLFLEVDGDPLERELAPGEVLKVDTGNVVAFENTVKYEIETVKGLSNIFLGGEGLFLTKLTGPGKVFIQSQNFNDFAGRIIGMIPSSK